MAGDGSYRPGPLALPCMSRGIYGPMAHPTLGRGARSNSLSSAGGLAPERYDSLGLGDIWFHHVFPLLKQPVVGEGATLMVFGGRVGRAILALPWNTF